MLFFLRKLCPDMAIVFLLVFFSCDFIQYHIRRMTAKLLLFVVSDKMRFAKTRKAQGRFGVR